MARYPVNNLCFDMVRFYPTLLIRKRKKFQMYHFAAIRGANESVSIGQSWRVVVHAVCILQE